MSETQASGVDKPENIERPIEEVSERYNRKQSGHRASNRQPHAAPARSLFRLCLNERYQRQGGNARQRKEIKPATYAAVEFLQQPQNAEGESRAQNEPRDEYQLAIGADGLFRRQRRINQCEALAFAIGLQVLGGLRLGLLGADLLVFQPRIVVVTGELAVLWLHLRRQGDVALVLALTSAQFRYFGIEGAQVVDGRGQL